MCLCNYGKCLMESWPAEVVRALARSKFGRDESKQYELVTYKPIDPILQEGPQCGLVALAMAASITASPTNVGQLFAKARELSITVQGELFDAHAVLKLCESFNLKTTVERWTRITDVVDCLLAKNVCLIPYDADANHEPCLKQGHRAHWLLAHGYLKELDSSSNNEQDLVLVQHGKSKFLGAFSLADLFRSNNQLLEADPKRRLPSEYCLPTDASLRETLGSLFIAIAEK